MYGTWDAPAVWQKVVKEAMLSLGFVCSSSNPSVFRHERRDILVVTHVDDFLCCAQRDDLDWLWKSLSKRYTLKSKVLGPNSVSSERFNFSEGASLGHGQELLTRQIPSMFGSC